MIKKIASSLMAILLVFTLSTSITYAFEGNYDGEGEGGNLTHNDDLWNDVFQGIRMYLVTQDGKIAGNVVDIPYTEYNLNVTILLGKTSTYTKFGDVGETVIICNMNMGTSGVNYWNTILGSNFPIPISWGTANIATAQGELIGQKFMEQNSEGIELIKTVVGNEADDGTLMKDKFGIANIGEIPVDVMTANGYRIVVEPLMWVKPNNTLSASTPVRDYYFYGTPEGICKEYIKDGVTTTKYNGIASYNLASYCISLNADEYKNKASSTGLLSNVTDSSGNLIGYLTNSTGSAYTDSDYKNAIINCANGLNTGNGLHIYFAEIEPEGGSVALWENYRYEIASSVDGVLGGQEKLSGIGARDVDEQTGARVVATTVELQQNSGVDFEEVINLQYSSLSSGSKLALKMSLNLENMGDILKNPTNLEGYKCRRG